MSESPELEVWTSVMASMSSKNYSSQCDDCCLTSYSAQSQDYSSLVACG